MNRTSTDKSALPQLKPAALRRFHAALAQWYAAQGRHDLPWRLTRDPYHIWVSEVMLQQTQVATVRDRFYAPFLAAFPTVEALAAAPREAVMKAWEGLGYYRRAGFLHEAAKRVASNQSPVASLLLKRGKTSEPLTTDYRLLATLPGIGRNTAHAILAFAHHQPVAILEANVKRIVARIFALETPSDAQLWAGADMLLNKGEAFDYNQAMMDLGAMVCTPKAPHCADCPAATLCAGKANPEAYPQTKIKKKIPTRQVDIRVTMDADGKLYLERRDDALLGGLWGFVQEVRSPLPVTSNRDYLATTRIGTVTHIYSHFRLEGAIYFQQLPHRNRGNSWFTREEIAALPLSKLDHKILTVIDARHTVT